MATDPARRRWLAAAAAAALACSLPARAAAPGVKLVTAWVAGDRAMAGVWQLGHTPLGIELPNRAHEVLVLPGSAGREGQALAVGRRPGEYLLRFDARRAEPLQWHDMETDRFLCGHASFSADGRTLYTTEFDAESGVGLIAERDPMSLQKRREYSSGGLGPHAMLVEPEGTLLVANGGLLLLPETGRKKLNRESMDSNIARLDAATGRVLATWRVADRFMSLRHIARAPDGTIAIASQAEHLDDAARRAAPLMALLTTGGLKPLDVPSGVLLEGYAGDIAHVPGRGFVASATRAGQLAWWSDDGRWLGLEPLAKASAVAARGDTWLASGDAGRVRGQLRGAVIDSHASGLRWDNHGELLPG